jgi:predicted acetyltransferase
MELRLLTPADEPVFQRALEAAGDTPSFARERTPGLDYAEYLAVLDRVARGVGLVGDQVRCVLLFGFVDGEIVGRLSFRPDLNDLQLCVAGQIGYVVLPAHRQRGHGSELLRLGLAHARASGLQRVLITCDEDNHFSRRIIEKNGGVYEDSYDAPELRIAKRRYWFAV